MFRYFGFHWTPADAAQAASAQAIDDSVRHAVGWACALSGPGLRVYMTGSRARVNGTYPLPSGQGVILGRLFRRRDEPSDGHDIALSEGEGDRIIQSDGRALIDGYWGRYTAVLQSSRHGARLLRDPSGTLPCYLSRVEGVAVFYSWLDDLLTFAPRSAVPHVDWNAVAARLWLRRLGGARTALEGVSQVLPGQLIALDASTRPPIVLWSAAAVARRQIESEPDIASAQLRKTVIDCSRAWLSCYENILLRLSGGVDSAILLGSLSTVRRSTKITCLNLHSQGSDSDERGYARLAAAKGGVDLVERERNAAFRLDNIFAVSRTPAPESYIGRMGSGHIDAEVADAHGAQAMFTGTGGDSVLFQFRCTWPAADYLRAHGPGPGFIRASLDAARLGNVSLLHSLKSALIDGYRRNSPFDGTGQSDTLARRDALDGARHLDRYVHPELLLASDLPIGKFRQLQELINPCSYYDPYLREATPEAVTPMLSQPLVELCLALPTWLLTHGGRGRSLARRAFADDIPREIATRQSKGGMDEHVAIVLHRNLPLARSMLLDGQLVANGLLDGTKVEAALAGRLPASCDYLGEIHDCIAIEAWLRQIAATPRAAAL